LIQKKQKIKSVKPELKKARFAKMFETQPRVAFRLTPTLIFAKKKTHCVRSRFTMSVSVAMWEAVLLRIIV